MKSRQVEAEGEIAELFRSYGWNVTSPKQSGRPDLIVSKGQLKFIVEIKTAPEARRDRIIPVLSQAILQVEALARSEDAIPLAIIITSALSLQLISEIEKFREEVAPTTQIGLVSPTTRHFSDPRLQSLNLTQPPARIKGGATTFGDFFSDLNQWMLKVLLAREIPETLLSAPRAQIRTATDLAVAANVSTMSASRFIRQMRENGYLDETRSLIHVVRRGDLLRRWQAISLRPFPERTLTSIDPNVSTSDLIVKHQACLGMFAAAEALGVGHVRGVLPYIYVPKLASTYGDWSEHLPSIAEEKPVVIVRQVRNWQSVSRGAVLRNGVAVTDILQVWLDVSNHPSRGAEQAELIQRTALKRMMEIVDG